MRISSYSSTICWKDYSFPSEWSWHTWKLIDHVWVYFSRFYFIDLFVLLQVPHNPFFFFKDLLIDWLLCWVFVSVLGLSLAAASGGHPSSRCAGLSLSWPLLLRSTGSRRAGSVVVAHRPSCSTACGIFPDQGSNPCPLHWQADSQPLGHQGSPHTILITVVL